MPQLTTQSALALALGVSAARISQLKRFTWFPAPPWDPDEVRRLIDRHRVRAPRGRTSRKKEAPGRAVRQPAEQKKRRKRPPPTGSRVTAGPAASAAEPPPKQEYPEDLLAVLEDPSADAVAIGTAAVRLAAMRFAGGLRDDTGGHRDLAELKQAMEELRKARSDYLDLAVREGELVPRSSATALAGRLVQQLLEILSNAEAMLPVRVEIWLSSTEFMEATSEQRRIRVTQWLRDQSRGLRAAGADELERLLVSEVA